jgi:hypothetical protein
VERGSPELTAVPGFRPENDLERRLASDPVLQEGLAWGRPRSGHPEGSVGAHVRDLLERIDEWEETDARRAELRVLALVHDALKFAVDRTRPQTGENHHAMRARRFAERYVSDERLLATLELHDRPYGIWRRKERTGNLNEQDLERMLERIPDHDLFLRFAQLDGSTAGKDREPVAWLRNVLTRRRGTE